MRTRSMWFAAAAVAIALTMGSAAAASKPPDFKACHATHACPSSTHSYVWHGLVCADRAHRAANDKIPTSWRGRTWWCHTKVKPVDALASYKARVRAFFDGYLATALQQLRTDAATGSLAAIANSAGLIALQNCGATLTSLVGTPPSNPIALSTFGQLQTMCADFQAGATSVRLGAATADADKINAGTALNKAALALRDTVAATLAL